MNRPYYYPPQHASPPLVSSGLSAVVGASAPPDRVGFTAPARIWPKIDEIEASAAALNRDVQAYVGNPAFRAAWDTWYRNWRQNYATKYQGVVARLGALTGSDELNANVENQREQLRGWYEQYAQQVQANGQPVPGSTGQAPLRAPQAQDPPARSWTLPWWFWLGTGALVAYVGYRIYRTYRIVDARGRAIEEKFVPALLERSGLPGKEGGEVLRAGREDRDYNSPLSLAYYARDARLAGSVSGSFDLPNYG